MLYSLRKEMVYLARMEISGIDEFLGELDELSRSVPGGECPECGGEIEIPLESDSVTCTHCGAVISIIHEG